MSEVPGYADAGRVPAVARKEVGARRKALNRRSACQRRTAARETTFMRLRGMAAGPAARPA